MEYSLSKEFVWKEVGDRVVVLNLDSGRYYLLNSSGSLIWRELMEGLSPDQIIGGVCNMFDVDKKTAENDTAEMIRRFLSKNMIVAA